MSFRSSYAMALSTNLQQEPLGLEHFSVMLDHLSENSFDFSKITFLICKLLQSLNTVGVEAAFAYNGDVHSLPPNHPHIKNPSLPCHWTLYTHKLLLHQLLMRERLLPPYLWPNNILALCFYLSISKLLFQDGCNAVCYSVSQVSGRIMWLMCV